MAEQSSDAARSRRERAEVAKIRTEMNVQAARQEAVKAQKLIDDFVQKACDKGLPAVQFQAKLISGGTAKTDKAGWYIKRDHSIGVGLDGGYYVLTVPGGWKEKLRGVKLEPTMPSLTVSKGGRDGESGDLSQFLQWTLDGRQA